MPLELDKTLYLPEHLRSELQKVHGSIIQEKDIPNIVKGHYIVCVGDVVTNTLLHIGIEPDVAVVDYKTKRENMVFNRILNFGKISYNVINPAGTITPELWNTIYIAMKSGKKVRIDVNGEEDLAIIPVVYFSPIGAMVIYGIPNTGLAILEVRHEDKRNVLKIIEEMEE